MQLAEQVISGDRLALARLLSLIENESPEGYQTLAELYPRTGRAHRVGVTGAPGSGKSALVNRLSEFIRSKNDPPTIGIVAIDPTSPYTGGAILGDRVRMRDLAGDPGIYIRSMANRGALGGLARTTSNIVDAIDAAGFELILIETVGAGQAEVDIVGAAHTVIVLVAPGMGDTVQALKAGVLEIADILVVNKSDLPGAEGAARALRSALDLAPDQKTPLLMTSATTGEGIAELMDSVDAHRDQLKGSGDWAERDRRRVAAEMERLLRHRLTMRFLKTQPADTYEAAVERVLAREISPADAIDKLLGPEA